MADPKLNIRIAADLTEIKRALAGLGADLGKFKKGAESSTNSLRTGMAGAARAVAGLAASLGAGLSAAALIGLSDEAQSLTAKLKLATKGVKEFNTAQAQTFAIAQRTRTSLTATVDLYARIERSTRQLGVNQATILALTESINQAAQLSGGGASAEAALFQLSQGLASGQLRGEELNSVLEQTPRLAQAIADGLDMPIGQLRKYAQEGKLSANEVLKALLSQRDAIAKEFAQLPASISGGFTQIRNALLQYLATSQEAGSAAATLAGALKTVADNLPAIIDGFLRLTQVVGSYLIIFRLLPALYTTLIGLSGGLAAANLTLAGSFRAAGGAGGKAMLAVRVAAGALLSFFAGWQLGTFLREQFIEVEIAGLALVSGLLQAFETLKGALKIIWAGIKAVALGAINTIRGEVADLVDAYAGAAEFTDLFGLNSGLVDKARKAATAIRGTGDAWGDFKKEALDAANEADAAAARIDKDFGDMAEAATLASIARDEAAAAGQVGLGGDPDTGTGKASAYRADLDLLRDSVSRTLAEIERLYEGGELSLTAYFEKKRQLQLADSDAAIAQAQAELKVADSQEAQQKALVEIEKLQRDRAEIGPRIAREQAAAEADLAQKLQDVSIRLLELQGNTAAAAALRLGNEFAELRKRLIADGNQAGLELVDGLFNLELTRSRLDAIRNKVQETIGDLRGTEELVAAQQDAGQISPATAEEQLQAVRGRSIEQLREYRKELALLAEQSQGDPEVLRQLQAVDTEIARVSASVDQLAMKMQDQAVQSLANFFTDLATGTKSLGDAFRDFVRSFVQGIAQIIAQELALKAVRGILSAFGGVSVPVQHSGGMAGSGPRRQLSPVTAALFAGAPRFHSGGFPGLKSDEVPSILQRGEEVLAKDDPRNAANGGGGRTGPGTGTRVINVVDPSLVQDYLDSPAGEETVLNIIGRNPGRVNQVLA